MTAHSIELTRRQALAGLGGVSVLALGGCATIPRAPTGDVAALLDDVAYNLLEHEPERATSLGVDTGVHAALRSKLEDQSPRGQAAFAQTLRSDLARVRAVSEAGLDADTVTSLEVVESAYATALDGFALPYGDVAVGSWRNAPYVVIQNVGTYLDMPRFLDSTQPLENVADGEAYIARLEALPGALDGELERMRSARGMGVVPPGFLLDKAIAAMEATLADVREGGSWVAPLTRDAAKIGATSAPRGKALVTGPVRAALERQLAELKTERAAAKDAAGMWAQPRGDEWYAWALRASTTTHLTPDQVHQQGLDELASLHARMDPILRKIGYTTGSVGERMQKLGDDPR
ncbi:MAG: DUF885 domain-containing protein, partial [Sphingomonadales bacterium]